MGAEEFINSWRVVDGQKIEEVFDMAVEQEAWNYGHAGYTGTLAEKDSFVKCGEVIVDDLTRGFKEAEKMAGTLLDAQDDRVDDKWGPAGCIETKNLKGKLIGAVFFGWASS